MSRIYPLMGYFMKVYQEGAPTQYVAFTLDEVSRNQDPLPPATGPVVNPVGLAWDDPDFPGRTRRVSHNFVAMLNAGTYTAQLFGQSQGGDTDGSEMSAPFVIDPIQRPAAPSGLAFIGE